MSAYDKKKIKQAAAEIMQDGGGIDGECEKHNLHWWDGGLECPACLAETDNAALRTERDDWQNKARVYFDFWQAAERELAALKEE